MKYSNRTVTYACELEILREIFVNSQINYEIKKELLEIKIGEKSRYLIGIWSSKLKG